VSKSVLLITRDFVPYAESLGGLIRMLSLADFLYRNEYDVYVAASSGVNFGYFGYENEVGRYTIHYINDFLKYNKDRKSSSCKRPPCFRDLLIANIRAIVRKTIIPDKHVVLVRSYVNTATEIIRKNGIRNVIVSSPPFSLQLVGTELKKRFGSQIMYLADYRDSWNTTAIHRPNNPISYILSMILERKVLTTCDHITFVSEPIKKKIEKKFGIDLSTKATLVMNGFSRNVDVPALPPVNSADNIIIGYFGSVSDSNTSFRNMTNLLRALRHPGFNNQKIEIRFFGKIELKRHDLSLFPRVRVMGSVSHSEALQQMSQCDYLLIVHSESKGSDEVITGKFFEYVAARRPIICLGPADMEANRIINEHRLGFSVEIRSIDAIVAALNSLKKPDLNVLINTDISPFHRDKQYQRILPMLVL